MFKGITKLLLNVASVPLGGRFADSLDEMKRVQWLPTDEVVARSETRLTTLLQHTAENVPYYRAWCQKNDLKPDELSTIKDLRKLPILTKSDYRQIDPEALNARNVPASLRIPRATSGSTGEPFQFSIDRRALPIIFASHLFYDSWYGFEPFDRFVRIVAPPAPAAPLPPASPPVRLRRAMTTRLQSFYEGLTQEKISLWELSSEGAENILRRIERFQPKFVMGYTSTLATIADELLQRNRKLSRPLEGVITIAETLTPDRKRSIERFFGPTIINRYGLREFGSWSAQSCRESPEQFHINTELVVCEVLRQDGTPCAPGETGRIVLTDLHNFARPFVRYDTGDLAVAVSESCSCGRGFPKLGRIEGRSLDCLQTPSGALISPAILGHFLFVYNDHLQAVRQYQLVQESPNRVRLLIVPAEKWDDERRSQIQLDLSRLIGEGMDVIVETVNEIRPEKSGKRPIIKASHRILP